MYTFTQFQSTPAIVTSVLIGVGIVFCGGAMVHNVFIWQKEKTNCIRQAPLNLNLNLTPPISTITPPAQFSNYTGNHIHSHNHLNHTPLTHISQLSHTTPVTPLSPNHSHISFNHSYVPSFGMRAATATPPTPKVGVMGGRDVSGSVSPGMDLSNVSPHELSTLV